MRTFLNSNENILECTGKSLTVKVAVCVCIARAVCTYIHFTQDHINNTTNDNEEVKDIPGVSKVTLREDKTQTMMR